MSGITKLVAVGGVLMFVAFEFPVAEHDWFRLVTSGASVALCGRLFVVLRKADARSKPG